MDRPWPKYRISFRKVKHPRLEYKTGTLLLVLPEDYGNPEQLLEKYHRWIQQKEQTIANALREAETRTLVQDRTDRQLRQLVETLVERYGQELNVSVNKVFYRRMRTKWASHSTRGNLTINSLLRYLPQDLIEYIVYHEMAHSLERRHSERFWRIVRRRFPHYSTIEKDLLTYWFLVRKLENACPL